MTNHIPTWITVSEAALAAHVTQQTIRIHVQLNNIEGRQAFAGNVVLVNTRSLARYYEHKPILAMVAYYVQFNSSEG